MNKFICKIAFFLISTALLNLFSVAAQAEITIQIQPDLVNNQEPFKLILKQEGLNNNGIPDLTPLQDDFNIISTERQVSYSVINGQSQSSNQWVLTLKALKPGVITIPPIKIGSEQSAPVTINVEKSISTDQDSKADADSAQKILLKAKISEEKPYVNQQIIYTVTLYNSTRLLDADYQGPQVENALLVPLGDARRYQTLQNNTNYLAEEQIYAIYPQKSGPLKIISPSFSALIYDFNPQRIKIQNKPLELEVQPIPKQYQGKTWLPAKGITLKEEYEQTTTSLQQGGSLIRTISIEGKGIPAQLLPNLTFAKEDGLSIYPEKGEERNLIKQGELSGLTEFKVTYLFNKAGTVTIPALRLPWFNTETGTQEWASLPAKTLHIKALASAVDLIKIDTTQGVPGHEENTNKGANNKNNWAWIIAFIFAAAWLITLALWLRQKYGPSVHKKSTREALNRLRAACQTKDAEETRQALLHWAKLQWPEASLLNLADLAQLVKSTEFKKQINLLSQALYKNQGKNLWSGEALLKALLTMKKAKPLINKRQGNLPPINPI